MLLTLSHFCLPTRHVRRRQSLLPDVWLLACLAVWTGASQLLVGQTLHTADAIVPDAQLLDYEYGGWTFGIDGDRVARQQVLRWGSWPGITREQAMWLQDGTWLCGDIELETDGQIRVRNDWLELPAWDAAKVRGLVFNPPSSAHAWARLQAEMSRSAGELDHVWLSDGGRTQGLVRLVNQFGEPALVLERDEKTIELEQARIVAIVFSPALFDELPPDIHSKIVGLADGTRLLVDQWRLRGKQLTFDLPVGENIATLDRASRFVQEIRYLRDLDANVDFLGDMQVAQYKFVPDSLLEWDLGVNQDVYGRPLFHDRGFLSKGLATHSASSVAFRWDGSPGHFLAEVVFAQPPMGAGMDPPGSVACQLLLGRQGQLEVAQKFELQRSALSPVSQMVKLDITDAQLIVLVTEAAARGQYGDHLLWLDARITGPESWENQDP